MPNSSPRSIKSVYEDGFGRFEDLTGDERTASILALLDDKHIRGTKLLDMGCGDGELTRVIGNHIAAKTYGFDISAKAAKLAKMHGVEAIALDIDEADLPYKNNYFDVIFCGSLIELVVNADHVFEEMHRVLSPKGVAIVTFPNLCAWGSRIAVLLGFLPFFSRVSTRYDVSKLGISGKPGYSTGFNRLFSVQSFREIAGFYQFRVWSLSGVSTRFLPFPLTFIDRLLSRSPSLAFGVIALLQKE